MAQHELLQFFTYEHLPPKLREASKPFCNLAYRIANMSTEERQAQIELIAAHQPSIFSGLSGWGESALGCNVEATWAVVKVGAARDAFVMRTSIDACLRKLLEAKDCAVRALLFKRDVA